MGKLNIMTNVDNEEVWVNSTYINNDSASWHPIALRCRVELPFVMQEISAKGNTAGALSASFDGDTGVTWGWGSNNNGQIGDGTIIDKCEPAMVLRTCFNVIAMGVTHFGGLDNNGQAWTWGSNNMGKLGNNSVVSSSSPTAVHGDHTFCKISFGENFSVGLDNNGLVWAWGINNNGQLGTNSTVCYSTPVGVCLTSVENIAAGYNHTFAWTNISSTTCTMSQWGLNNYGQLGIDSTVNLCIPMTRTGPGNYIDISGGYRHSLCLLVFGGFEYLKSTGYNNLGQLGLDNVITTSDWTVVKAPKDLYLYRVSAGYDHSLSINISGNSWSWGGNDYGQLGDETVIDRCGVGEIKTIRTFCQIQAATFFSIGLDNPGQGWGWGYNYDGSLGNGTVICQCVPVSIKQTY